MIIGGVGKGGGRFNDGTTTAYLLVAKTLKKILLLEAGGWVERPTGGVVVVVQRNLLVLPMTVSAGSRSSIKSHCSMNFSAPRLQQGRACDLVPPVSLP
jgi:hypothetical protein